jgi:hypothetical protein
MASPAREDWIKAIDREVGTLERLDCWDIINESDMPRGHRAIGSKFVFRAKRNKDGAISSYKARLVAQGFSQREGVDFSETFAPVAKFTSIRTLLALAARHNYHVEQADVDSAYIQAKLDPKETVYIRPPPGLRDEKRFDGKVLKLKRALYGLKQSGRVWNLTLHTFLVDLGYRRLRSDACTYAITTNDRPTFIAAYVDDLLFVGSNMEEIKRVKAALHQRFGIKDLGAAEWVLGIQVARTPEGIWLGQRSYLEDVLKRFGMHDCRALSTPMAPGLHLRASTSPPDPVLKLRYLQAVGSLMYAMLGTRPDLCHTVSYLSRYASNPTEDHWAAIMHVLRYIRGTTDLGIFYSNKTTSSTAFYAYSDSDFSADINTSKSTMGYVFTLSGGAISWSSKLQSRVAHSSTEAEYIGLGHAMKEGVHICEQLDELGFPTPSPMRLFGDNQGANALAHNPRFHERSKHILRSEHIAREYVEDGKFVVEYIPTNDMVADIMTKSLPRPTFEFFCRAMGITAIPA